jgi:lipopolysaccharide/colanic/teichoic acid biosynthesis glycosyltransferase
VSYETSKRLFDLVITSALLALLSPLLLAIAAAILITSGPPVLYRGRRIGRDGQPFDMLKFRTMVRNAETIGASSTSDDDPRITRVGAFLRRYKLDELPQLINVVRGEMSLVGPRPQVAWAVELYTDEERGVLSVLPGITDYASMHFPDEGRILRGSVDPDADYMEKIHPTKMRLSLEYVRDRSLRTDLEILASTARTILARGDDAERDVRT